MFPSRVLVAHSYFLAYDAKQTRKMRPYAPLATLLAAAVLRRAGVEPAFFDAMLSPGVSDFQTALAESRPGVVFLFEDSFNFLTKMCTTRMREAAIEMIGLATSAGARVAVSGPDASDHPEIYLAAGAEAVVVSETETVLLDLLDAFAGNRALRSVPGLVVEAGTNGSLHVARTKPQPFLDALDELPHPAWDLVDAGRYRAAWTNAHGRLSWNMVTTRGCPFHCNWCAKPLYGTRYAQRSPASVADELAALTKAVAPEHIWFADDIFGLTPRWIETYAEALAARGLRVPFTVQSRVDLMTESGVEALAHAGAEEVWMGVESGAQHILDAMQKGTTIEKVRLATRRLKAKGIRASWFLQLGYPGEDWHDILATRDLVREEAPDDVGVSVSYPLPGTAFHESVKHQLGAATNWKDSDDLAMMFAGTFTGPFYKRVRDLLHAEALPDADRKDLDARWQVLTHEVEEHRSESPTLPQRPGIPLPAGPA